MQQTHTNVQTEEKQTPTELFVKSELKAADGSGSFPRNFTTTTTKAQKTDVLTDTLVAVCHSSL